MSKFEAICRELIKTPIVVVDVGADGGVHEIDGLASLCEVHAFELRQDSFEQLKPVDAESRYATEFYYSKGLARTPGQHTLFVTRTPQASSLLRPNVPLIQRWRVDNAFDLVGEIQVDCITLEQFTSEAGLTSVDLIKIDTQGSELDILLGGRGVLRNISIIKSEVEFVRLYESQSLFDDMVRELSTHGFRFVAFGDGAEVNKKRIWADCLFIQHTFEDHDRLLKAAMILIEMSYYEEARWLLADHGVPTETWQKIVNARVADLYPKAELLVKINCRLKKITGGTGPLENLRRSIVRILLRSSFGRAAALLWQNRYMG